MISQLNDKLVVFPDLYMYEAIKAALLAEVGTTPKPGLVDQLDSGAHTDMDYTTFIKSTFAVAPYILKMGVSGFGWPGNHQDVFSEIREVGKCAEKAMLEETGGVNTHKGAIFSMGVIACAAGYYYRRFEVFDAENILKLSGEMTRYELQKEFEQMKRRKPVSYGEKLYAEYGERGIRGQAMEGFPAVRFLSLPLMKSYISKGMDWNKVNIQVLLSLMSAITDTNILHRGSWDELAAVNSHAMEILKLGGAFTKSGMEAIKDWNARMIEKNLSPGGCADLLAVTIFCWILDNYRRKK